MDLVLYCHILILPRSLFALFFGALSEGNREKGYTCICAINCSCSQTNASLQAIPVDQLSGTAGEYDKEMVF